MAVRLGNIEPVDFRLGDKQVERLCLGNEVVWKRRLIEGVDYEKYQWLAGTLASIDIPYYQLSQDFRAEVRWKSHTGNSFSIGHFYRGPQMESLNRLFLYLYTDNNKEMAYLDWGYGARVRFSRPQPGDKSTIEVDYEYLKLWGVSVKRNKNYFDTIFIIFLNSSAFDWGHTEWGNFNLFPSKLLRDIPAFLADDNKPHPAGECGMIDEISGKFYGNANSTGAFTVSND